MSLTDRAKNILLTPAKEWDVIATESTTLSALLTSYVIPMAALPAIASVLGGFLMSGFGMRFLITTGIVTYASAVFSFVITAYVVDLLAVSFKSEKNLDKSAQLVAYSATASWVGSILSFVPLIGWLGSIAGGIYAVYLMYLGVGPIKKTSADQRMVYVVIVCVVLIAAGMALAAILSMILLAGMAVS